MICIGNLTSGDGDAGVGRRLRFAVFLMIGEGGVYHFPDSVVQMHRFSTYIMMNDGSRGDLIHGVHVASMLQHSGCYAQNFVRFKLHRSPSHRPLYQIDTEIKLETKAYKASCFSGFLHGCDNPSER